MNASRRGSLDTDEAHILTMVRRQLEIVEKTLSKQLIYVQEQVDELHEGLAHGREAPQTQLQNRQTDHMEARVWECVRASESSQRFEESCSKRLFAITAQSEDMSQSLINLHTRLSRIEEGGSRYSRPREPVTPEQQERLLGAPSPSGSVEGRIENTLGRVAYLHKETDEIRSRFEAQEERLNSLRELLEVKDDVRFNEIQIRLTNLSNDIQDRLSSLKCDLQSTQANASLAACVPEMVEQLQGIAPKVIEHESRVSELNEHVRHIEGPHLQALLHQQHSMLTKVSEHDTCLSLLQEKVKDYDCDTTHQNAIKKLDARISGLEARLMLLTDDTGNGKALSSPSPERSPSAKPSLMSKLWG